MKKEFSKVLNFVKSWNLNSLDLKINQLSLSLDDLIRIYNTERKKNYKQKLLKTKNKQKMGEKDYLGKDQRKTKDDKPKEEKPIKGFLFDRIWIYLYDLYLI